MLGDAERAEVMRLLAMGMHGSWSPHDEARLQDLVGKAMPHARRFRGPDLQRSGEILVGAWVLEEILESAAA